MIAFFMAWQMFLWIPCPVMKWDESKKKEMLLFLPVVGMMMGGLWYLLFILLRSVSGNAVSAALFGIFPWLVTGFMHMDGYMDCADAFLYFGKQEKKLAILKDSHVGSFAVICTAILAVLQYAAASQIMTLNLSTKEGLVFVFVPAISRAMVSLAIFIWDPLPTSSYVGLKEGTKPVYPAVSALTIAAMLAVIFFVCGYKIAITSAIGAFIQFILLLALKKNLGGMSGDISGATLTAGELASLIALAFI